MTLATLRGYVEEYLDQSDTDAFFYQTTIKQLLNEAYRACYSLIGRISPEYVMKEDTGTITSGATSLTLPSDFMGVYILEIRESTGDKYKRLKYYDYQRYGDKYTGDDTGYPYDFYIDKYNGNNEIKFLRATDQAYLYSLKYKTKLVTSDLLSADGDSPDLIPEDYQMWLVYYAAIKYLPKDHDQSRANIIQMLNKLLTLVEVRMAQDFSSLQMTTPRYLSGWREGSTSDNG